ncbi:MAG: hypothetical protein ACRDSN_06615, partial [Pseudonocardiaceae bacterium]
MTGAPEAPTGGGLCGGLRIVRTAHRIFDEPSPLAAEPSMRPYLSDMVGPYGLALRDEVFDAGAGHSYGEMAEPLIEAVVAATSPAGHPPPSPVDLLVMAYAIHDVRFGRNTATYLSSRCPGDPLALAVCDQGVAAPFSALRAADAYAATGACRRALLLVVEQSALHYELAEPARVPDRHAAVALLLETFGDTPNPEAVGDTPSSGATPGTGAVTVRQRTAVPPDGVDALLAAVLAELPSKGRDATLILGADLATEWTGNGAVDEVVLAPAGQPYTGVWWELSAGLP